MSFEIKTGITRRSFFKWLGVGTAAAVVAPSTLASCGDPWCGSIAGEGIIPHDELHDPWSGPYSGPEGPIVCDYANYTNFSAFALAAAIDDIVSQTAAELGAAAGRDIAALQMRIAEGLV